MERAAMGRRCDGGRGRELIVRQQEATPKQRPGCTGHSERRRGLAGPGKAWLGGSSEQQGNGKHCGSRWQQVAAGEAHAGPGSGSSTARRTELGGSG
jgi:hypothetical protein